MMSCCELDGTRDKCLNDGGPPEIARGVSPNDTSLGGSFLWVTQPNMCLFSSWYRVALHYQRISYELLRHPFQTGEILGIYCILWFIFLHTDLQYFLSPSIPHICPSPSPPAGFRQWGRGKTREEVPA